MNLQDNYKWEAEISGGEIISTGDDLTLATRLSLIPQTPTLPRHDIIGVKLERRFCRGFLNALGGGMREYVHCVVTDSCRMYVRSSNGQVLIAPKDYELYL